jgi:hypothetical protein
MRFSLFTTLSAAQRARNRRRFPYSYNYSYDYALFGWAGAGQPIPAERKKAQAAAFVEPIGEPDRGNEFRSMSTDEYDEGKGLRLTIPD